MRGLKATIVADLMFVLNFTVPWIFNGMDQSWKNAGCPRSMSLSVGRRSTENSITFVVVTFLSSLTKVSGRFMVSICP